MDHISIADLLVIKMIILNKFNIMNKIFSILLITSILYSCQNKKDLNKSVVFIDCSELSNNLGTVAGMIIKKDSIYSCVKTNKVNESIFRYSFVKKEFDDLDKFIDHLTTLADNYNQEANENVDDGANYVLIIKNDHIEKKYHFNSALMSNSLYKKIEKMKNYYKLYNFKEINKFNFPIHEMCIDTIPELKPFPIFQ